MQPRPAPVAVADREIDILAREVDVVQRRAHAQVNARMQFGETAKPMHEPLGGEIR